VKINALSTLSNIAHKTDARTQLRQHEARVGTDAYQPSNAAIDFNVARKAVSAAPDIREGKVASLQARIQGGEYNVSAWDIAAKLVDARV
jgi:negative regulator of flagellin synthesis FlgM